LLVIFKPACSYPLISPPRMPRAVGVRRHAEDMDLAGTDLDHEEHAGRFMKVPGCPADTIGP